MTSEARRSSSFAALCAVALLAQGAALGETKPQRTEPGAEIRSMLWVGNSFFYYNNSMHSHVVALGRELAAPLEVRGVSITISGSGLDWHDVASYLRPDAVGRYSWVANNQIVFNKPGRQFDAVIMMDCSQCPVHPQLKGIFHEQVKKDSTIVEKYGARPILFMSWAYKDKPEMTGQLAEQYTMAGNANDALVIPAGLAFARAIAKRPGIELYQPDKRHPSLAGTYLGAATVFTAVTGKSTVSSTYTAGLDPDLARFLRETAVETVHEYYGKAGRSQAAAK
ncbi:MAG TPA: hypothetical protein VG496_06400 [Myxococcales bacterium]|nr:hypothetical protein [Myxococcales bacterium]